MNKIISLSEIKRDACKEKRICKREKYIEIGRVRDRFIGSGKESHYIRRGKEKMGNR